MNKEEFNQLDIQHQVDYINKYLEKESVTKICAKIGIDRSTVRKRFKTKGYELIDNKYIATETTTNTKENITIARVINKPKEQIKDSERIQVLENKVESLEKELEDIKSILNTINTVNTITTNNIEIKKYTGADSSRSYRVNNKVLERWKYFCKAHSEYKVGDLLANAMIEYIDKFN